MASSAVRGCVLTWRGRPLDDVFSPVHAFSLPSVVRRIVLLKAGLKRLTMQFKSLSHMFALVVTDEKAAQPDEQLLNKDPRVLYAAARALVPFPRRPMGRDTATVVVSSLIARRFKTTWLRFSGTVGSFEAIICADRQRLVDSAPAWSKLVRDPLVVPSSVATTRTMAKASRKAVGEDLVEEISSIQQK